MFLFMLNYNEVNSLLLKYHQEHILKFYNELTIKERKILFNQIESIDFSILDNLKHKDTKLQINTTNIKPISAITIDDINKNKSSYLSIGKNILQQGKVAAILLAGGQGTRLGFDKPKGMYNIGITKELFIFECLINNLIKNTSNITQKVPLYIMTSTHNNVETIQFFKNHNFFNYGEENIRFFIQNMNPCTDYNGKLLMSSKYQIAMSPNGNGGWFDSLIKANMLQELKDKGVEWLNVFSVDNVLQQIADPIFIGATVQSKLQMGSKVLAKTSPEENMGVLCLKDNRPFIIEYYELPNDLRFAYNEHGELLYKYGVTLNYLFNISNLEKLHYNTLPTHVVSKIIPYINTNGKLIYPKNTNGYKFETLALDMVNLHDNCLAIEILRDKEFAPVKNLTGNDSVDSARQLLLKNNIKI